MCCSYCTQIPLDSSYIASQYLPRPSTTSRIAILCVQFTGSACTYNSVLLPLASTTLSTATRFTLLCVKRMLCVAGIAPKYHWTVRTLRPNICQDQVLHHASQYFVFNLLGALVLTTAYCCRCQVLH